MLNAQTQMVVALVTPETKGVVTFELQQPLSQPPEPQISSADTQPSAKLKAKPKSSRTAMKRKATSKPTAKRKKV